VEEAAKKAGQDITVPFVPGRTDASQEQTDVDSFAVLEPNADGFRNYLRTGEKQPAERLLLDQFINGTGRGVIGGITVATARLAILWDESAVQRPNAALSLGRPPTPCPHFAHTFGRAGLVQGGRDGLQIVVKQVGVHVQRHRCARVPEHPLDRLDVGPRRHRQAGGAVPQVVGRHPRHARYGDGFDEPPVGARSFEVSAILAGELQIVAVSPVALAGQVGQQELGQRHAAPLVRLRGSHANLLAHLDGVLRDGGPSAQHVQVADPQADGLTQCRPV